MIQWLCGDPIIDCEEMIQWLSGDPIIDFEEMIQWWCSDFFDFHATID